MDDLLKEKSLPIREVSRLTSINSVTLRAWERRYGLIKPLRTHKGHRLYSASDVALILKIQDWLARGLAIGKVSEMLESGQTEITPLQEDIWQELRRQLLLQLADLNPNKIERFLGQVFADYPPALVADYLVAPCLAELQPAAFGNRIKQNLLENRLVEMLLALSSRQRAQAFGKSVALAQLAGHVAPADEVLLQYALIMNQIKSELLGQLLPDELVLAATQMQLDALVIFNHSASSLADFNRQLTQLADKLPIPIIVGGFLAQAPLAGLPANVHLAPDAGQQGLLKLVEQILEQYLAQRALAPEEL